MTDPVYSGEALLRNWSETANGKRRIVLEIEDNGGAHPFKGYEGERFAVVVVGPLASDEHENSVPRKGKAGVTGAPKSAPGSRAAPSDEMPPASNSVTLVEGETGGAPSALTAAPPVSKLKRRWSEMPPSQRAALLTKDPEFQVYVREMDGGGESKPLSEAAADRFLKEWCRIASKSQLKDNWSASPLYDLESNFQAWRQARGHGVV